MLLVQQCHGRHCTRLLERKTKKSKMGSVKLKVKSASASIDDLELDCDLDWTALKVKSEISTKYPGHPSPQVSIGRL